MTSKKVRVLFIANGFPRADDPGKGVFNLRAVRQLSHYVDLHVVTIRTWRPFRRIALRYDYEGINVKCLYLPFLPLDSPHVPLSGRLKTHCLSARLSALIAEKCGFGRSPAYDLVHSVSFGLPAIIGARLSAIYRLPHVSQAIGSDINVMLPRAHHLRMFRNVATGLSGLIANSMDLRRKFECYYPSVTNVATIYRGVDLDSFSSRGYEPISTSPIRFLYLGGYHPSRSDPLGNKKGGVTILTAWRAAEESMIACNAELLIGGVNTDSEIVGRIKGTLKRPTRIKTLGVVHPTDVPGLMTSSDAVVIPSLNEGLPNVGMEAMAASRPILGSNVGGLPELVRHGVEGLLFPAADVSALAELLRVAASNRAALYEMGRMARLRAQELFDSSRYGEKVSEFYSKTLDRSLQPQSI
jgi:teichuronic acid biosynthesis glycosyltransferase TuaC